MPAGHCARCNSPAEFRSPLVIGRVVVGLLSVLAVVMAAVVAVGARSTYLIHIATVDDDRWSALHSDDDLLRTLQSTDALLHLLCGVTFIVWFHRCYRNTPARERRRSTAWAVWGWVIPIVSWWQPKRIANDMLRSRTGRFASLRVVNVWWALYLPVEIITPERLHGQASAQRETRVGLYTLAQLVELLAALAAIAVVRQMTASQLRAAAEPDGLSPVGAAPADTGRPEPGRRRIGQLISAYWIVPVGLATAIGALLYLSADHAQEASPYGTFSIAAASTSPTYDPARQRAAERLVRRFVQTEAFHPGPRATRLTAHAQPRLRRLGLWLG
ncbi:MAG TPA: DUF4328 domain-containing protein, partial [Gaiellales bacterium]|nr:DUF4328 domain-containing protein [Gaiellales bacterium]